MMDALFGGIAFVGVVVIGFLQLGWLPYCWRGWKIGFLNRRRENICVGMKIPME